MQSLQGTQKEREYLTWATLLFYLEIVLLLVLELIYLPLVELPFGTFLCFLLLDAVRKGETDLSTKHYCLGLAFLIRLALLFLDKHSPGNAPCCTVVPLRAPRWPSVDRFWMQLGVLAALVSVCNPLTILYLTTSWSGYENWLMLKSFEDTGCFINANYYIQVCYSLGIRPYLGSRWGSCEM